MARKINRHRARARTVNLTAAYTSTRDGWIHAQIVGGRGLITQGRTFREASDNLLDVLETMLDVAPHQFPTGPGKPPRGARFIETFTVIS